MNNPLCDYHTNKEESAMSNDKINPETNGNKTHNSQDDIHASEGNCGNGSNVNQEMEQQNTSDQSQVIEIEIDKNKQLYETLKYTQRTMNAGCLLMLFLITVFIGLTVLSLTIIDRVPYSSVMSNEYGVFEMKNEKTTNYFFLFNTAELWGESGIKVHKGERITIKASGLFNTEIRHMVEKENPIYWITADGRAVDKGPNSIRDSVLKDLGCLIRDDVDPGCLMAAILKDENSIKRWVDIELDGQDFIKMIYESIKPIGTGAEWVIPDDGTLLFAVNDVVFTDSINKIIEKCENKSISSLQSSIRELAHKTKSSSKDRRIKLERMWYNDNVGSFLIVIEKRRLQEENE